MAKKQEKHLSAKQKAYQEKQARQGEKVVKWIISLLMLAAVATWIYMSLNA